MAPGSPGLVRTYFSAVVSIDSILQYDHTHHSLISALARTGTKSIEKALQSLGHRVYDMRAAMELKHMDRWVQAATDWKEHDDLGGVKALVQEMEAAGFTATLDLPMNLFALAFAELRPKAKVLFSVRDTKEKWMESLTTLSRTFGPFIYCRPYSWIFPKLQAASNILLTLEGLETTRPTYPTHLDRPFPWFEKIHTHPIEAPEKRKAWMELHQRFQKRLQQKLSKDRLLVFNVKQGWAPLIPFLGIQDKDAVTRQDFPNIHDGNTLKVIRRVMDLCAFAAPVIFLIFLWIMTRVLHTCVRCKLALDERRMKAKRQ